MTTIYLIRHAEAEGNLYRIAQGQYDGVLTRRGYEQLKALRRRFEGVDLAAVYSSDLFRARTTARAVSEPRGLTVQLCPELREVHMGSWEGRTWQEIEREDPEGMEHFTVRPDLWQVPGAEAPADVARRMIGKLKEIARAHPNEAVAAVSHGAALRITVGVLQGLTLEEVGKTHHSDNTAVTKLVWDGNSLQVEYRDDSSHLVREGDENLEGHKWWNAEKMFSNGPDYMPMDDTAAAALAQAGLDPVPREGECIAVWHDGKPVGVVQLLGREGTAGRIGTYWMAPSFRGHGLGIVPLGQAVLRYRAAGCDRLRLRCGAEVAPFFEKYGFVPLPSGELEQYIGYEEQPI